MSLLQEYMEGFKTHFAKQTPQFDSSLSGKIKKISYELKDESLNPSNELKLALKNLQIRTFEPMKVAITGQFSSGKSTFLNALLSKDILPTGITPVTSKVNYIRYGDEFKIKVTFQDGVEEYHSLDGIGRFTDQREAVEDIAYLTIYAPLQMLKEVVFVDTPGLNSQAKVDTKTTQKVLKSVDGIIWLTLIDNAGKMSEAKVLQEYLSAYKNKTLCVLNQKDKFTNEQIGQTLEYVKKSFDKYFSSVIPISAIEALKARSYDKKQQIDMLTDEYISELKSEINIPSSLENGSVEESFKTYKKQIMQVYDQEKNDTLLRSSNINEVISFIDEQIRPHANESKKYAITKEVENITSRLTTQHQNIIDIYEELSDILKLFEANAQERFNLLKVRFTKEIKQAYEKIENIIDKTALEIFDHIQMQSKTRYVKKEQGLIKKHESYTPVTYEVASINADVVYKKLFFDEDLIGKMFKKYVKNLRTIQDSVNEENALIYSDLQERILQWQAPYELIRKNDEIHSDIEYANVRKFASKVYENFLKPFNDEIRASYAQISSQFNHLSSAVSFNYQNATEVCVAFLEHKIAESIALYEESPTQFPLYSPNMNEIKNRLVVAFHLYELENLMNSNHSFLDKNYDWLMKMFDKINRDRQKFIQAKISYHQKSMEKLNAISRIL